MWRQQDIANYGQLIEDGVLALIEGLDDCMEAAIALPCEESEDDYMMVEYARWVDVRKVLVCVELAREGGYPSSLDYKFFSGLGSSVGCLLMNSFSIFLDAVTSYSQCLADLRKMPSKWEIPYIDLKIIWDIFGQKGVTAVM
ncbi:hypothetical protein SDJN02_21297, partial [Cucurbita argyrosperma subsp. argyrosperma]